MTYKTLTVIHSLLEQETQRRHDLYKEAADRYSEETEGPHRTEERKQFDNLREEAYAYFSEASNALNDFENQDFR